MREKKREECVRKWKGRGERGREEERKKKNLELVFVGSVVIVSFFSLNIFFIFYFFFYLPPLRYLLLSLLSFRLLPLSLSFLLPLLVLQTSRLPLTKCVQRYRADICKSIFHNYGNYFFKIFDELVFLIFEFWCIWTVGNSLVYILPYWWHQVVNLHCLFIYFFLSISFLDN